MLKVQHKDTSPSSVESSLKLPAQSSPERSSTSSNHKNCGEPIEGFGKLSNRGDLTSSPGTKVDSSSTDSGKLSGVSVPKVSDSMEQLKQVDVKAQFSSDNINSCDNSSSSQHDGPDVMLKSSTGSTNNKRQTVDCPNESHDPRVMNKSDIPLIDGNLSSKLTREEPVNSASTKPIKDQLVLFPEITDHRTPFDQSRTDEKECLLRSGMQPTSGKSSPLSRTSRSCSPEYNARGQTSSTAIFRISSSGSSEEDIRTADIAEDLQPKSSSSRFHVAKVSGSPVAKTNGEGAPPGKSSLSQPKRRDSSGHSRSSKRVGLSETSGRGDESNRSDSVVGPLSSSPPPLSELAGSLIATSYDTTTAQKTFGRNTLEKLPHEDHYRNLLSTTAAMRQRPTLLELHELDIAETKEQELYVEEQRQFCAVAVEEVKPLPAAKKFGWVEGVLVRCVLNIFGVMLFLRMSWVVGQAGLGLVTCIILLASVVTIITALSMSAICTNGQVRGGGAYYMISRSLGPEFGGAIGVVFSLANAVAAAMYIVGFAETIRDILLAHGRLMIDETNDVRVIGLITACVLIVVTLGGLAWEAKAQVVLLGILIIAVLNFMIGTFIPPSENQKSMGFVGYSVAATAGNFGPDFRKGHSFFSVFAIFFPAATGILAGANISGDLKDAQKAIPLGTLLAILITTITYIVVAWMSGTCVLRDAAGPALLLGAEFVSANQTTASSLLTYTTAASDWLTVEPGSAEMLMENRTRECVATQTCAYGLQNDMQVMQLVSAFGPITIAGIISATLSSALASMVSAPKIFQAVAKDRIFPYIHVFAQGSGSSDEPRRAYFFAFILCVACIGIGDLNAIAPLISNFFLMSYALINYSCFDASLAKSPGWRPAFRYYSMWLSLLGAVLCMVVMFVISWVTALVTLAVVAILFFYVHYRKPDINWGSSTQAHVYRNALQHTHKLIQVTEHVKNFRPQLLVLTGLPRDRPALVDFCASLTKNIGLMVCGHVVIGDPSVRQVDARIGSKTSQFWLTKRKTKAFYSVVTADSLRPGAQALLQAVGLGKLRPNIVMLGFKSDWLESDPDSVIEYVNIIHDAFDQNYGVGILRLEEGFCNYSATLDVVDKLGLDRNSSVQADISNSYATSRQTTPQRQGNADKIHINIDDDDDDEDDDDFDVKQKPSKKNSTGKQKSKPVLKSVASTQSCDKGGGNTRLTVDSEQQGGASDREATPLKESSSFAHQQRYMETEMNSRFRRKQRKGFVDVWWLFDDGGLTLLVPYILTTKKLWSNCKLRVFIAASKKTALDRDQRQMATMLNKFRIEYSSMTVVQDIEAKPKAESTTKFNELIADWVKPDDDDNEDDDEDGSPMKEKNSWKFSKQELQAHRAKTMRHIRLRELLQQHSHDASLIVMTLPMPRKGFCPAGLYMAWIDTLTRDMPPVLLLRGNQENVLTYYS